jgi:hypothetical protein
VFHCPQAGHFPIHFGDSWPQLEHTYAILSFAILSAKLRKVERKTKNLVSFFAEALKFL